MKAELINDADEKTYALIFDKGDEVIAGLEEFAKAERLSASQFTAIGAFSDATLGFFDRELKDYRKIPLNEQVEVLSLLGNFALAPDGPKVHAHAVVGKPDGTAHGGHLLRAHVWPTLEVIVVELPVYRSVAAMRKPDGP